MGDTRETWKHIGDEIAELVITAMLGSQVGTQEVHLATDPVEARTKHGDVATAGPASNA